LEGVVVLFYGVGEGGVVLFLVLCEVCIIYGGEYFLDDVIEIICWIWVINIIYAVC
jgi:hypothetical protein